MNVANERGPIMADSHPEKGDMGREDTYGWDYFS